MFTAASGVVAFEQGRYHEGGHPKDQISANLYCTNNVETSKDKILSAEGTLQEMYRQKPLYDLSLI